MGKFISKPNLNQIYGVTRIVHKERLRMKLGLYEYTLMAALEETAEDGLVDTRSAYEKVRKITGFNPVEYKSTGRCLIDYGMLEKTDEEKVYRISDQWVGNLPKDIGERFEKLWKDSGMIGNKKAAQDMYMRAIKEESPDYLDKRMKKYLKFIQVSGQHQAHLSSWLNPVYKKYNDNWKTSKYGNEEETGKFQGQFPVGK